MFCLPLLRGLIEHLEAKLFGKALHISLLEKVVDAFGSHLGDEFLRVVKREVIVLRQPGENIEILVF